MSIQSLSLHTNEEILHLLALQIASYRVEADLIGFEDIPPLKDGIQSIREAEETFYGYYVQEENERKLVGAISYSREGCVVTICRMMVHPHFFGAVLLGRFWNIYYINKRIMVYIFYRIYGYSKLASHPALSKLWFYR